MQDVINEVRNLLDQNLEPGELARRIAELVYEAKPAPIFQDGEEIQMHEFEARFRRAVCLGNEITFAQWPLRVFCGGDGGVYLALGIAPDGVRKEQSAEKIRVVEYERLASDLTADLLSKEKSPFHPPLPKGERGETSRDALRLTSHD